MAGKSGFVQIGSEVGGTSLMSMVEPPLTFGQFYKCFPKKDSNLEFNGLTTHAEQGIVDTAAQSGLIGEEAFNRLEKSLEERGLKPRKTNRQGQARGVGGEAISVGVAELPLGIAGVNGVLEVTIVKDEVPLLLPVSLLRDLGACVDLVNNELKLGKYDKKASMRVLKSGHVSVDVMDFDVEGWRMPQEAQAHGLQEKDFQLLSCDTAMSIFKQETRNQFDFTSGHPHHVDVRATQQDFSGYGTSKCFVQCGEPPGGKACQGHAKVEGAAGETAANHPIFRRSFSRSSSSRSSALARRWLALWLCSSFWGSGDCAPIACISRAYEQARDVRRADQDWHSSWAQEDDEATNSRRTWMQSPDDQSMWSREPISTRGVVPGMPCSLEGGDYIMRTNDTNLQVEHYFPEADGCISSKHRSSISVGGSEVGGNGVSVQASGSEDQSAEGRADQGSSFLQVRKETVRLLCLGSDGARGASEEDVAFASGSRDQSRGGEDEGRNVGSHETSKIERGEVEGTGEDDARGASGEGGSTSNIAAGAQPECKGHGGVSDGSCRSKTWRADAGAAIPASDGDRDHAEPTTVDDGGGWRGQSEPGAERSTSACRVYEEGVGDQAEHDAIAGPNARGGQRNGKFFKDLTVEEMDEMKRVAPWACKLSRGGKAERVLRCGQLEDEYEPAGSRRVSTVWWSQEEGSATWKFHNETLPEENSMEGMQVVMAVNEEAGIAEDELDEVYAVLSRSSRRRFEKGLNKVIVSELYSQPRVSAKAAEMGLQAGSSFDLKNGYDFNKDVDRCRAWGKLKKERPDLLIVCPPCGPFSQLQSWNYKRMEKGKAMVILGEGVAHLEFAMKVFEWQVRRGGLALFEHPAGSKAWQEESVQKASRLEGVRRVVGDQCQFSLRVRPQKRSTRRQLGFSPTPNALQKSSTSDVPEAMNTSLLLGAGQKGRRSIPLSCVRP